MNQKLPIRQGLRIPEPARGRIFQWLASGPPLRAMVAVINAISNGRILVNVTMPDGSVQQARGQLLISDVNAELQVPVDLTNLTSAGGSGSYRVFAGAGAPVSATLLAAAMGVPANFLNGLNPDLYVDTSALALYFCSTAGTDTTSVWKQISSSGGGNGYCSEYNGGGYKPGSIVYMRSVVNLSQASSHDIVVNGQINVPGFYGTANGIPAADDSNNTAITNGQHVGAHNVPGWPKQNDWELLYQPYATTICSVNAQGQTTSATVWLCGYPYVD